MAITSIEAIKTHLVITDDGEDAQLTQWLEEVESLVLSYCRPGLLSAEVTEYHDGEGLSALILNRRPVTAVAGVWVDAQGHYGHGPNAFAEGTEWVLGQQWAPRSLEENEDNGSILVVLPGWGGEFGDPAGVWPRGAGNIKVTYTAGYTTPPPAVALAVHHLVAAVRKSAARGAGGPVRSETIGRYSYQVFSEMANGGMRDQLGTVRSLLAPYKREPW